ncbi:hypothetical protein VTL71DRAFT_7348 [Oculimacula yallundae]|uniref:Uncharacterized protein n=1 Tax=Oculimacula yallundae TaxID=86028 RepID=A0ABR4BWF9_9HELO
MGGLLKVWSEGTLHLVHHSRRRFLLTIPEIGDFTPGVFSSASAGQAYASRWTHMLGLSRSEYLKIGSADSQANTDPNCPLSIVLALTVSIILLQQGVEI